MLNLFTNTVGASILNPSGPAPTPVPVVDFSASTTGPIEGNSVNFTDLSTGSPTAWQWEFPGGTPTGSTGQNPSVLYSSDGNYNVTLYATNAGGTGSLTKTNYIQVQNYPVPVVDFVASPTGGTAGSTSFSFTDLSTNSPTSWLWNFGSGATPATSTSQNPSGVTYSGTGPKSISLSAGNTGGTGSASKSDYITITSAPAPVEQTFTADGTWTCCAGATYIEVIAVGGGAGGRSTIGAIGANPGRRTGGGGGGAGEVVVCQLTTGFGSSQCVRIGSGGGSNTAGAATCFGTLVTALGGAVGGAPVYVASAGSSTTPGGDGGGSSSDGGASKACAANFGSGGYISQNAGDAGCSITAKPGGGAGGGGYSACAFGYQGCGGAGGAGGTICGITLGNGGNGGTNCNGSNQTIAVGCAASGYGAGGGGAASTYDYDIGTTRAGGAGGAGVMKVIQYFDTPPVVPMMIQFNTSYYYTPTEDGSAPLSTDYYYNPNI
jgi:PKD repeat protein